MVDVFTAAIERFRSLPQFADTLRGLKRDGGGIASGLWGSSVSFFLSALVKERPGPYLVIAPSVKKADILLDDLLCLADAPVHYFPVLETFEDDMEVDGKKPSLSWRREGNLFLMDEAGVSAGREAYELRRRLGCAIEWWSPQEIKANYPLYETRDLAGGTFGPRDGYIDGYAFLMGYKTKARSLGAESMGLGERCDPELGCEPCQAVDRLAACPCPSD